MVDQGMPVSKAVSEERFGFSCLLDRRGRLCIQKTQSGTDVLVLSVTGQLTRETGLDFADAIVSEIHSSQPRILFIDLSEITHFDNSGLGCILRCHFAMEDNPNRGRLLFWVSEEMEREFSFFGFDDVLDYRRKDRTDAGEAVITG
jgi:anti-anti-sigma factor